MDKKQQYKSLALKYRPKKLQDMVGQSSIVTRLKGTFKSGKIPQTMLFHGHTGSGKTTFARMVSMYINCLSPVKGEPCGKCESCKYDVTEHPDVFEINMAEARGIDDVRAIIKSGRFMASTKYRVFILDELHQITPQAREAFLKPLEEPHEGTIWILCTTNPEKLSATVLNRCVKFEIKEVTESSAIKLLSRVVAKEGLGKLITDDQLAVIANLCRAVPRDCLSALESVIAYVEGMSAAKRKKVNVEDLIPTIIKDVVSLPPQFLLTKWLRSVYRGKYASALLALQEVENPDYFCRELINYHIQAIYMRVSRAKLCKNNFYRNFLTNVEDTVPKTDPDYMAFILRRLVATSSEIRTYLVDGNQMLVALTTELVSKARC